MKFTDYIRQAEEKVGGTKKLAQMLEIPMTTLCNIKAETLKMKDETCVRLGVIVGLERPVDMIAIQHASRAKTEQEAEFWTPFVQHVRFASHAPSILLVAFVALISALGTSESRANSEFTMTYGNSHNINYAQSVLNTHYQQNR